MSLRRRAARVGPVAVVTDSTATLPAEVARAAGVRVVPLDVLVDGERSLDGERPGSELVTALERGARVSTSQPPAASFRATYERAVADGASAIVSVHLSAALSGTVDAARVAARDCPVPVLVVDSGTVAMGLGYAVLAAARAASGQPAPARHRFRRAAVPVRPDAAQVAATARAVAATASVWFLVDSLDHLRRGGRLSGPQAVLGTILGLRPLLAVVDGRVTLVGKVRTRRAARARLEQLAVDAVLAREHARVAVHHVGRLSAAGELADAVAAAGGARVVEVCVAPAGAVLAAHAGPGVLAVVVTDA